MGWSIVYSLGQKLSSSSDKENSPQPQTLIHIQAPPQQMEQIATRLSQGAFVIAPPDQADLSMIWQGGAWTVSSTRPGENILLYPSLQRALNSSSKQSRIHDNFLSVKLKGQAEFDKKMLTNTRNNAIRAVVPMGVFVPIIILVFLSSAAMAMDMESSRSSGYFEPLALAPLPFWVYLLAKSTAQGIHISLAGTLILLSSLLFIPTPHPLTILCFSISTVLIGTALSMLGSSLVFVWRSKITRAIGGVLFIPLGFLLVFFWLYETLLKYFNFYTVNPETALGQDTVITATPIEALISTCITFALSAIVIFLAARLVEWRLGARRYGLSSF